MPQVQKSESTRHQLWEFVKRQIVDDVPEDLKICEVYCHKEQCMQDEWDTCERRIRRGAGELFPASPPPKEGSRPLTARPSLAAEVRLELTPRMKTTPTHGYRAGPRESRPAPV